MHLRQSTLLSTFAAVGGLGLLLVAISLFRTPSMAKAEPATLPATVSVMLYDSSGTLVGPVEVPSLHLREEDWQKTLSKEQCYVLRNAGTERAGTGELLHNKKEGIYACAACRLPLFISDTKFESGTGWPSFFQPVYKGNVREIVDRTHGMTRTEVECARCGGHLGHVFDDGPQPTGMRYCMNSLSLKFVEKSNLASLAEPTTSAGTPATRPAP